MDKIRPEKVTVAQLSVVILRLLREPKFNYGVCNRMLLVHILMQSNPVRILKYCLFKSHFIYAKVFQIISSIYSRFRPKRLSNTETTLRSKK